MKKIYNAFMFNVVFQGFVAAILVGVACYLYVTGQKVPQALLLILGLAVGLFFGSRASIEARK